MAIDFILQYHPDLAEGIASKTACNNEFCVVCNRFVRDTFSGKFVVANVYGKSEIHCLGCQLFFHPNAKNFGPEGFRGRKIEFCTESDYQQATQVILGSTNPEADLKAAKIKTVSDATDVHSRELVLKEGNKVEAKLGMMPGCLILLTRNKGIFYAPGKYLEKVQQADRPLFELVQASEVAAMQDCIARITPSDLPFLFVSLSKKKADQIKNLELTTSIDKIKLCSDTGVDTLKASSVKSFELWKASDVGQQAKLKDIKALLIVLKGFFTGTRKYEDVLALVKQFEGINAWIKTLPDDPHEKIGVISFIQRSL